MAKGKRTLGRPTSYKPEYCQLVIEHMSKGLSFESFAGVVGTCKQTIYNWTVKYPEFLDARNEADAKCRLFWEKSGIQGMFLGQHDKFNATVWVFNMKNRFHWRDMQEIKQEVTGNQTINISQENIIDLIKQSAKDK
jgi:hypothetical protein